MKKVLLGTTALVAAGAFAGIGAAQAQDVMLPMKAGVGGYYNFAFISTDTDGAMNDRGHGFNQNIEMEFQGETTLDNGITAGVRIRINGNNGGPHDHSSSGAVNPQLDDDGLLRRSGDTDEEEALRPGSAGHTHGAGSEGGGNNNIDETEIFFKGAFGALHLGMIESAGYLTQSWAPGAGPIGNVKSNWFGGIGGWGDSGLMMEDSTKVVYFSPSFNGITFAVSYAPESSEISYSGSGDAGSTAMAREQSEQLAIALSYSGDIMGGSFSANVSQESHSTEAMLVTTPATEEAKASSMRMACTGPGCDPSAMRYGASISIDDISLGANVMDVEDAMGVADFRGTEAGIGWSQGPLSLGIQHGSTEKGEKESDILAFTAGYNLGPGIDVGARYSSGDTDGDDYSQFVLGTFFNF